MKRNLTCIICPRGCSLTAEIEGDNMIVTGNGCPKGKQYAIDECTNPTRTVTSCMRIANKKDEMVSVKTEKAVPKSEIFEVMRRIRSEKAVAPIKIGDIMIADVCHTNIVATKNVD